MWLLILTLACTPGAGRDDTSDGSTSDCTTTSGKVGLSFDLVPFTDGTSGTVHVDDDCTVRISDFTFTYTHELDTRFELWLNEEPAGVPDNGWVDPPITNEERVMTLPRDFTHDDWDQISLFDPALNVLHAYARP